jgi:hypothetical protein
MRVNAVLFWILTAYFVIIDAVYVLWGLADSGGTRVEPAGAVGLALSGVASALIAFYLTRSRGAQGGELPEDRMDADIDDGDPEMGFYSPWSWWPICLAGALALVFLGVAIGIWISLIGIPLMFLALVGWIYEYYRRFFSH